MAYSADNELQEELGVIEINSHGEYIIVKKITNKTSGSVSIDIRRHYTDDEDVIKPTTKGLRIKDEAVPDVILAAAKSIETTDLVDLIEKLSNIVKERDAED